ncbi:helix-turn-helix domain-containing protein [Kibdelosporangium aridum]|uniref:Helix-turn-helix domain-containing protein n=1 Tax=Kibdelosporangium aridum TaxID=2030 RepID=A0A1Y5Y422_KIBAR|nr:helix-turn-helix transcriptional regulator [Kibdelosporangium aridum]SMD23517.1 Helix-turn-helix domain-containing protein [Kibdelosporangium aridum]
MTKKRGTARIRGLAAELKDLRTSAGLNTRDAARRVGMSPASLNRMERGNRVVTPEDMSALLVAYGVTGAERERLLAMSREADLPEWWETTDAAPSKHLRALINFESEATRIVEIAMLRIPGLMQTPEYIRELMMAGQVPGPTMRSLVATRIGRQRILTQPRPPQYLTIIDEAAVSRPVGDPHVMAAQLRHIITLATYPNIEVRVIPFARGAHTGLDGSFITLEFPKARPIVLLEHKRSSGFIDQPEDVAPFHQATTTLMKTALGPLESVNFLADKAAHYDRS